MTVEQRIKELNTKFQKSYYDVDGAFFTHIVPEMIGEIDAFMSAFLKKHPGLELTFENSLTTMENVHGDLKHFLEHPNPKDPTKDQYLNGMKKNISEALWNFRYHIYHFEARMLQEVV